MLRKLSLFVVLQIILAGAQLRAEAPIPVILDTDIGDDVDDSWALAFLLKSPELDLKLALGEYGNSPYRAKLLAKFLTDAGRTDVPVGMALDRPGDNVSGEGPESAPLKGFDLKQYRGVIKTDGVQALIDTIMSSPTPVTVISIGPPINIAAALRRQPDIAKRARFIGMIGHIDAPGKVSNPEYNASRSIASSQAALSAPWDATITPIETCGQIVERGENYQRVLQSRDPVTQDVIAGYQAWTNFFHYPDKMKIESSPLYDTLAVYLAFAKTDVNLARMPIIVDAEGRTVIDPAAGKSVSVTTDWKSLTDFEELLATRLAAPKIGSPVKLQDADAQSKN